MPGVSVSQVARRYDVNANQVFNWLKDPRFAPATIEADLGEPVFLPVEIVPGDRQCDETVSSDGPTVEITLSTGQRLTIRGAFDPDTIARLIKGLEA